MQSAMRFGSLAWGACAALAITCCGCNKQEAGKQLDKVEQSARGAASAVSEEVSDAVKEGEKAVSELGEKAVAHLGVLKEKFGKLDSLKESPAELKTAVADLIQSIEAKAEGIQLPEKLETAMAAIKEKLVALQQYLAAESDPSKIKEHVQGILDSVKSELGMSSS